MRSTEQVVRDWKVWFWCGVLIAAVGLFGIGMETLLRSTSRSYMENAEDSGSRCYREGRQSRKLGTPATANPYQGHGGASSWLRGWEEEGVEGRK